MELKLYRLQEVLSLLRLLIVPYGIETPVFLLYIFHKSLLIVPYGIETFCLLSIFYPASQLLIVPYGIETLRSTIVIFFPSSF